MRVSLFSDAFDEVPRTVELSWADFAAKLGPHKFSSGAKENSPAFSPATFREGTTSRKDENVTELSMFVCDIDHATGEQALAAMELVVERGLAAIIYSTWRHAEDPWRLRICVPLSRPVPASEWRAFWERANKLFLNLCDKKCKNPSRIFFGPFAPVGTEEQNFYEVVEGTTLDVDSLGVGVLPTETESFVDSIVSLEKLTRDRLEKFAKVMCKKSDDFSSDIGMRLLKIVKGDPFAEPGERDNVIFKLASSLAKRFPNCDPASVAALFAPSLQLMSKVAGECPTVEDVAKKFQRAQQSLSVCVLSDRERERISEVFGGGRDTPYTAEEIKAFGPNIKRRWIVQYGKAFYVFCNGTYNLYSKEDVLAAVVRDLAPAKSAGVELFNIVDDRVVQKGAKALVQEYGTVALHIEADYRAQFSYYNEITQTMVEAPCPLRKGVKPVFHEEIDVWLQLISGPRYEELLDWLAWVYELGRPCVALFVTGPKGTGKSLLGYMAASPFGTPPTPLEEVFGSFNAAMLKNPVCMADEHLPKDHRGHSRNPELRFHVQAVERQLHRKHLPNVVLRGATRTLVVANNMNVLSTAESLSVEDIDAIGARYLYIEAQPEAAEYLEDVVGHARVKEWVDLGLLAEHMLWLRENRKVESKGRFLMKPSPEIQNQLLVRNGPRGAVCQWFCSYLLNRELFDDDAGTNRLVRIKNGRLLANVAGIVKFWTPFVPNEKCPPTGVISEALAGISHPERYRYKDQRGNWVKYRHVDVSRIFAWVQQSLWIDEDRLKEILSVDTEDHTLRKKK